MKYKITEKEFYYVPESDERYNNDNEGVIWTEISSKKVNSLREVVQNAMDFIDAYKSVQPDNGYEDTLIYLVSNVNSDKPGHKNYYYTKRHVLDVTFM